MHHEESPDRTTRSVRTLRRHRQVVREQYMALGSTSDERAEILTAALDVDEVKSLKDACGRRVQDWL